MAAPGLSCGMWDLVPWPRIKLGPLHREHGVLTTRPLRKSLKMWFIMKNPDKNHLNQMTNVHMAWKGADGQHMPPDMMHGGQNIWGVRTSPEWSQNKEWRGRPGGGGHSKIGRGGFSAVATFKLWSECQKNWREVLQAAEQPCQKIQSTERRQISGVPWGLKWGSERQGSPYYMGLCGPMLGEKFGGFFLRCFYCDKIHTTKFTVLIFFNAQFDVMKYVHNVMQLSPPTIPRTLFIL